MLAHNVCVFCLLNTLGPANSRVITPVIVVITSVIYPFISFIVFTTPFYNILQPIGSHFVPKPTVFLLFISGPKNSTNLRTGKTEVGGNSVDLHMGHEVSAG